MSNLEVIKNNIYILDVIIDHSSDISFGIYDEDRALVSAATRIKNKLLKAYTEDTQNMSDLFLEYSYMVPIASKGFGEAVHMAIGKAGTPGLIIELVRTIGNVALNMADVSEECTKLYAIAFTSNILSNHYLNYLNAGNGINNNGYWIFYSDNSDTAVKYLLNLFVVRKCSEEQMKATDEANSFLTEWLFANILYKTEDCDSNSNKCNDMIKKYLMS